MSETESIQRDKAQSAEPARNALGKVAGMFGIKAKLSLAFLVMVILTVGACAIAWLVFGQIQRSVSVVTERSIPELTLALSIAEVSADITAGAPAIIASQTQADRLERRNRLDSSGARLMELIERWQTYGIASDVVANLSGSAMQISDRISAADAAIESQLSLAARIDAHSALLDATHDDFLDTLEPIIDDAVFDLVITSETGSEDTADRLRIAIEHGTTRLDRLTTLKADGNLLFGLMRESLAHGETSEQGSAAAAAMKQAETSFAAGVAGLSSETDSELWRAAEEFLDVKQTIRGPTVSADSVLALADAHENFIQKVQPEIEATREKLLSDTRTITGQHTAAMSDLVDTGALTLLHLLSLRADGNFAVSTLREAVNASDAILLTPLGERFDAATGQMDRAVRMIPAELDLSGLRNTIGALLDLGTSQDSLFELRRLQLADLETAGEAVLGIHEQSIGLGRAVAELVRVAESISTSTATEASQVINNGRLVMLVISAASILCALIVVFAFVGPRLIRPIEETTDAMTRLAAGDTDVDIPGIERGDELGHMAHALGVFRDITIEVQESNLREIETARRRLSDAIESISEAFSLYDRDDRLVVCNEKYGTLVHPEIADQITPGLTFEQILRRALEAGFIESARGREDEWIAERLARHRNPGSPHIMQRVDGLWIMISERKTAEGGIVAVYSDITELKERENELAEKSRALEQLSSQLSKYLSPQVYQSIFTGQQAATVTSQRKKLTVFFSDLEGFTEIADRLESEDMSQLLNEYLTEMSKIALDHGATIDKYVGDSIMIFFGDPFSRGLREDALACVRMAIAMQKRLQELSERWSEHGVTEEFKCRMGIATGFCTVGNFGSEDRMDYTIIGGTVNLASRLESAAAAGSILISGETHTLVQNDIPCRTHETIQIKGLAYPVKTFVVETETSDTTNRIVEHRGKLKIDLDPDSMTDEDRELAVTLLSDVMDELSKRK